MTQILKWLRGIFRNGLAGMGRGRSERRMELVETLNLGSKRQLLLIVCDGQRILVGAGGDSVASIVVMDDLTAKCFAPAAVGEGLAGFDAIAGTHPVEQEVRCC